MIIKILNVQNQEYLKFNRTIYYHKDFCNNSDLFLINDLNGFAALREWSTRFVLGKPRILKLHDRCISVFRFGNLKLRSSRGCDNSIIRGVATDIYIKHTIWYYLISVATQIYTFLINNCQYSNKEVSFYVEIISFQASYWIYE